MTEAYWKDFLENFSESSRTWLEGFDIPTHQFDEAADEYSSQEIFLTSPLITDLKKIAKQQDLSYLLLIQGAFGLLLNRYTGLDEVIYGQGNVSPSKTK